MEQFRNFILFNWSLSNEERIRWMNCIRSSPNLLSMTINGAWDNSSVKNTSSNSHSTIIGPWSHEPPIDLFPICYLSQRYSRGPFLTNPVIIYLRTTSTSLPINAFILQRRHSYGAKWHLNGSIWPSRCFPTTTGLVRSFWHYSTLHSAI